MQTFAISANININECIITYIRESNRIFNPINSKIMDYKYNAIEFINSKHIINLNNFLLYSNSSISFVFKILNNQIYSLKICKN